MSNPTLADFYKYALLATGSYVRMGGKALDEATFTDQAALPAQAGGRIPLPLGTSLFRHQIGVGPTQCFDSLKQEAEKRDPGVLRSYFLTAKSAL